MFVLLVLVNGYWFIMYKLQDNCYLLLPYTRVTDSTNAYTTFRVFFLITLICKTIAILITILKQTSCDVFVMDWENHNVSKHGETENNRIK